MKYWNEMDFTVFCESRSRRERHHHTPYVAAFDTETTTVIHDGEKVAFMYVWQMAIENEAFYGRTWQELKECLRKIKNEMYLAVDYKLIVYIHNLKYDFGFYKHEVNLEGEEDFVARSKRTVLKHIMDDCFEIRDSAVYTEEPLEDMGVEVGIPKMKGYDYTKIRHALTPLTPEELHYCENDVLILTRYFRLEAEKAGCSIYKLPLTYTQSIKRGINYEFSRESRMYQAMIMARQLKNNDHDNKILQLLKKAFFGAFNYSSQLARGITQENVAGIDISACYGAQCLLHPYPMSRFDKLELPESTEDLKTNSRYKGKAMLITFAAKIVSAKYADIGFLPINIHNYWQRSVTGINNVSSKRILTAEKIEMTLTDVDFKLFLELYDYKKIKFISILGSDYGEMPPYMIRSITNTHAKKLEVQYKNNAIKRVRPLTLAEQLEYTHAKTGVSRIYGILVQDPERDVYKWDAKSGEVINDGQQRNKAQFQPILYQWGVWVVAWARYEIIRLLLKLSDAKNKFDEMKILYSDTDSLYFQFKENDIKIIEEYNAMINAKIAAVVKKHRIDPAALKGIGTVKTSYYDKFKTTGIKQYCYIQGGEFDYRCSGLTRPDYVYDDNGNQLFNDDGTPVNNGMTFFDNFDSNDEKMAAFNKDLKIPASEAHVKRNYYSKDPLKEPIEVTDYLGNAMKVQPKSWVVISESGFDFDKNPFEMIEHIDEDRFDFTIKKLL